MMVGLANSVKCISFDNATKVGFQNVCKLCQNKIVHFVGGSQDFVVSNETEIDINDIQNDVFDESCCQKRCQKPCLLRLLKKAPTNIQEWSRD